MVYGGSAKGLMGKLSEAAYKSGGEVIAVEPRFFLEQGATTEFVSSLIETETMSERKQTMIDISDCFIALPGGIGTLDEISEVLTDIGLGKAKGKLILFNVNHFYDSLIALLAQYRGASFIKEGWRGEPVTCSSIEEIEKALEQMEGEKDA